MKDALDTLEERRAGAKRSGSGKRIGRNTPAAS